MIEPSFKGEVMLAGWSESHNGGAKITFWLPESSDLDAFKSMTVAKGKMAGQRLMMVAVEIGDDEQPVRPATPCGPISVLAFRLCKNPEFQNFLEVENELAAANLIKKLCGIQTRRELDTNEDAALLFHSKFRVPFLAVRGA
jgi:hypothetical protein